MKWVLLWVVISGRGVTNDSAVFDTQQACQTAVAAIVEMKTHYESIKGVCVPAGGAK